MKLGKLEVAVVLIFLAVIIISPSTINPNRVVSAVPDAPHEGTGLSIAVHEFASSLPSSVNDAQNGSSFTYPSTQFPSGYRGYRLQANVSDVQRTMDPVPNGSF